ncbi:MAG TPA: DNA-binding protein [Candidatus Thermoplasmatota archaeon]|nr:DNA-binding protein [Candidatus Thermoplasmatota archaeon]
MDDAELEELRRRRMAELQAQAQGQQDPQQAAAAAQAQAQADAQKEMVLRAILEPEARERLTRVRMARPDIAQAVEGQLIALYQQGRIRQRIDDATLRELLARMTPKGREPTIERR